MVPETKTARKHRPPRRIPVVTWDNLDDVINEHDLRQQDSRSITTAYCRTCRSMVPGYLEAHRHAAALPGHVVHIEMTTRVAIGTFAAILDEEWAREQEAGRP